MQHVCGKIVIQSKLWLQDYNLTILLFCPCLSLKTLSRAQFPSHHRQTSWKTYIRFLSPLPSSHLNLLQLGTYPMLAVKPLRASSSITCSLPKPKNLLHPLYNLTCRNLWVFDSSLSLKYSLPWTLIKYSLCLFFS